MALYRTLRDPERYRRETTPAPPPLADDEVLPLGLAASVVIVAVAGTWCFELHRDGYFLLRGIAYEGVQAAVMAGIVLAFGLVLGGWTGFHIRKDWGVYKDNTVIFGMVSLLKVVVIVPLIVAAPFLLLFLILHLAGGG